MRHKKQLRIVCAFFFNKLVKKYNRKIYFIFLSYTHTHTHTHTHTCFIAQIYIYIYI